MRTLILFRHSKAASAEAGQGDETRPLTARGRREAGDAGAALLARFAPDVALVSTAARTRETAAEAFKTKETPVVFDAALYLAEPQALWRAFAKSSASVVVVVAHNPGLAELAALLIESASDRSADARLVRESLPTSAWAAFEIGGGTLKAPDARFLGAWRPKRD
jgi:phosphohistidine phosphatase